MTAGGYPGLAARDGERTEVAIDLGGTWLRIRSGGRDSRVPSPSVLNRPGVAAPHLIRELVDTLCAAVPPDARVAMSVGAAMDEETGVIHGSGPLWGGGTEEPVPLADLLRERRPDVSWRLVNDVTAGLGCFAERFGRPADRRIGYLTISSGIALRVADMTERSVPVDAHGMQGEVGHLAALSTAPEAVRRLPCACGGLGHVSSIAAGPALPAVAAALGVERPAALRGELPERVRTGDGAAQRLLSVIVEPVAELLRVIRCLDPRIDLIGLGGGYVEGLSDIYRAELIRQLGEKRSYADRWLGREWAEHHVRVCDPGELDTLAGAGAMARGLLTVTKK
ncbi:ROK family protein [Nocardia sp. NPDC051030]|uniref:ROK family protein n=1 Tax=Nocardia sp. NPDC051030 TaxID=3155162 RepID=UPI003437EE0C